MGLIIIKLIELYLFFIDGWGFQQVCIKCECILRDQIHYLQNATAEHEHDELGYNIQMVCPIKEGKNVNRSNLIAMEVFKPTIINTTK